MNYEQKRQKIVQYIKKGEKSPDEFTLGLELEHFVTDKNTHETIGYFGDESVSDILNLLKDKYDFKAHEENGHVLSLHKGNYDIATEPAAQFEVAINSKRCIKELEDDYKKLMEILIPILDSKNLNLTTLGYHPKSKIDDIKILPKKRYEHMYNYFQKHGAKFAHNMMKGTASMQVTIDFENETDFKKKYFVANALSPFIYSTFDNAYIFESKKYEYRNLRQTIWQHCDRQRTGVYPFSFDDNLSYEKYADHILNTDIIFVNENGEDIYKGDVKFKDLIKDEMDDELIFHALSIVFPDVRVKRYIEIRMADEVNYPLNFSYVAFTKGIFYNQSSLDEVYEILKDMDIYALENLKSRAEKDSIKAKYKEKTIRDHMLKFCEIAKKGLDDKEKEYLDSLIKMLQNYETPRDIFEKLYEKSPSKAIDEFSVKGNFNG
ncbi:MAG: glutamate-cysteine ligase family protein [Tissierellia bacterium]|nr:glutamate-cysteine ligase family protein [Tissierellia bacterium]